jgi:hypothetical protein
LVEELLDAGAVLRCAMEKALRGDASELRPARAGERSAVDAILVEAGRRLDEGGYRPSGVMSQRMAATLRGWSPGGEKQADGARSRADAARQAADAQRAMADDFGSVAGT